MASHIEEAKSGRASCRTCKTSIGKGELRLGVEVASQFSDATVQWHHLKCAVEKLPAELKEGLDAYHGDVANRAELDAAMAAAIAKGNAKPGGYPYIDRAPTGRARCMHCKEPIDKGTIRVAVEREVENGGMVTTGAGYLHPKCAAADKDGAQVTELLDGIKANSRLPEAEVDFAIADIEAGAPAS